MLTPEREALIRRYAAAEIGWRELQARGFEDYVQVLGASASSGCARLSRP